MKVRELIEELQKYDGELRVLLDGYEGGAVDITVVRLTKAILYAHEDPFMIGEHEVDRWEGFLDGTDGDRTDVIYIPRND